MNVTLKPVRGIAAPMRALAVLLALAVLPAVAAQTEEEAGSEAVEPADPAAEQARIYKDGYVAMVVTGVAIVLGAAAMWWVNHRYHPPGETARAKSRRD